MRAAKNSHDAAFGPLRPGNTGHAAELHKDLVAVHGVFDGIAGDENVAVKLRHGLIRHNEAVAVMVEDEATFDLIAAGDVRRTVCGFGIATLQRGRLFGLAAGKAVTSSGKFFDGATLLEFGEHFEEMAAVGFPQTEAAGDVVRGSGRAPNLQKTQYVIGVEMGGEGHKLVGRSRSGPFPQRFYPLFFKYLKLFSLARG
jgi:hypothetical protein